VRDERIEARAPTRVDLAGGTIDLWPLYLLHDDPLTVNAAIDLYASATIEPVSGAEIHIASRDRDRSARFPDAGALTLSVRDAPVELEFAMRLVAHFLDAGGASAGGTRARGAGWSGAARGCRVTTDCMAPAGSGLGGSSALGIALSSALDRFTGRRLDPERLLAVTRGIETQVLRIPTGEQDYHPALHGGVLALHYTVEGTVIERLSVDADRLRERTVLVFSGQSRSSGISNWDMLKRHLDGDTVVRDALESINHAAQAMRRALLAADWDGAGAALADEWAARTRLSPTVTTPDIDRMIAAAIRDGALAGKVCGAGGGGCIVFWVRDGRREAVLQGLQRAGALPLDVHFVPAGVVVTES